MWTASFRLVRVACLRLRNHHSHSHIENKTYRFTTNPEALSAKASDRVLWLRVGCCCLLLIQAKTSLVTSQVNEINFRTAASPVGCMMQDMLSVTLRRCVIGFEAVCWLHLRGSKLQLVRASRMRASVCSFGVIKSAWRLNMIGLE
jgi:hypothetical protein